MRIWMQKSASIQLRTSPLKFGGIGPTKKKMVFFGREIYHLSRFTSPVARGLNGTPPPHEPQTPKTPHCRDQGDSVVPLWSFMRPFSLSLASGTW